MKILKACLLLGALSGALFFTGCASIVRGSTETISFQSTPSGAEVRLSTGQSGVTPCQLIVQRKGEITVTVHKDGYKDYSTVLVSAVEGGSLGLGTVANLLTIPIINDIVDYKTGANYAHKPNPLLVNLIPVTAGPDEKPAEPAKTVTPPPSPDKTAGK